jgi:hypothetical protein
MVNEWCLQSIWFKAVVVKLRTYSEICPKWKRRPWKSCQKTCWPSRDWNQIYPECKYTIVDATIASFLKLIRQMKFYKFFWRFCITEIVTKFGGEVKHNSALVRVNENQLLPTTTNLQSLICLVSVGKRLDFIPDSRQSVRKREHYSYSIHFNDFSPEFLLQCVTYTVRSSEEVMEETDALVGLITKFR